MTARRLAMAAAAVAGLLPIGGLPAQGLAAAEEGEERVLQSITSAPCGGTEQEIVVCGRARPFEYRLPPDAGGFDPEGPIDSVARERHRLLEGGESGIGSCSNVGPGGFTGCDVRGIRHSELQGKDVGLFGDIEIGSRRPDR